MREWQREWEGEETQAGVCVFVLGEGGGEESGSREWEARDVYEPSWDSGEGEEEPEKVCAVDGSLPRSSRSSTSNGVLFREYIHR